MIAQRQYRPAWRRLRFEQSTASPNRRVHSTDQNQSLKREMRGRSKSRIPPISGILEKLLDVATQRALPPTTREAVPTTREGTIDSCSRTTWPVVVESL